MQFLPVLQDFVKLSFLWDSALALKFFEAARPHAIRQWSVALAHLLTLIGKEVLAHRGGVDSVRRIGVTSADGNRDGPDRSFLKGLLHCSLRCYQRVSSGLHNADQSLNSVRHPQRLLLSIAALITVSSCGLDAPKQPPPPKSGRRRHNARRAQRSRHDSHDAPLMINTRGPHRPSC